MDMPDGIFQPLFVRGFGRVIGFQEGDIFVHRLGDHIEIEFLGGARLLIHEQRQAFLRPIGQPIVQADAIALGL